jgi:2-aminoadipate transaminase
MVSPAGNWEAEQLQGKLSRRVHAIGSVWWVAGARQEPPPVPPIMFTGGIPDPDTLPTEELIEVSNRVLRREGPDALRYGGHQGYEGLRAWLAEEMGRRDGISLTADNFTITNGVSGALANVCEAFLDEGDVGLTESPTYPGGAGTIRGCLGEVESVLADEHGIVPEALEETIGRLKAQGRRVKLLYTIPTFQNPTGVAMTLERRRAVVEICQRHEVLIVEDDAYGDVRFEGERLPSLFALAGGEGAVHLGTFSKTVATGLRVGWVLGSEPVIEALVRMRFDLGVSPWLQRTMAEYGSSGLWARHVAKMNEVYRHKRDTMLAVLEERCSRYVTWNRPEGGYFLWLRLSDAVDPAALSEAARNIGVAFVGGQAFKRDEDGRRHIRLALSFVNEQEIPEGIMRLGRALEHASGVAAK